MSPVTESFEVSDEEVRRFAEAMLLAELRAIGIISSLIVSERDELAWLDWPKQNVLTGDYLKAAQFLQVRGHMSVSGVLVQFGTQHVNLALYERYILRQVWIRERRGEADEGARLGADACRGVCADDAGSDPYATNELPSLSAGGAAQKAPA